MGVYIDGVYVPALHETGWGEEINDALLQLAGMAINAVAAPYGADPTGVLDSTTAIQSALNSLPASGGEVYLPPGAYKVSDTITIGTPGAIAYSRRLVGAGSFATTLAPTSAFGSKPVIKVINGRRAGVTDLYIHGNTTTAPRAAIEFNRNNATGLPAVTQNFVRNCTIGALSASDPTTNIVDGIRVTFTGADGNCDFGLFENNMIQGFTGKAYSFEVSNSVGNLILGGYIAVGPVGVSVQGGSFTMIGTTLGELSECEFDFLNPITATYTSASIISGVFTETDILANERIIRTTTAPYIDISISNYTRYGAKPNVDIIDYNSAGMFSMSDSRLQLGQDGQVAKFTDPGSHVQFSGTSHGFTDIQYAGALTIIGGHNYASALVYTPLGGASHIARVGAGPAGAWGAYTPTLGGAGWAIGNGTVVGRYVMVGSTVHWRATVTFGSTSTFGASAAPTVAIPVAMSGDFQAETLAVATNAGSGTYALFGHSTGALVSALALGAGGALSNVTATVPFAWGPADSIEVCGTYEAA